MTYSNGYGINEPTATPDPDGNIAHGQVSDDGQFVWDANQHRWVFRFDASNLHLNSGKPPMGKSKKALLVAAGVVGTAAVALSLVFVANNSVKEPDCTGTSDASCVFNTLDAQGIEYNNVGTSGMDELGDALCTLDESGVSTTRMVKIATDNADMWTTTDATTVVDLVLATYCPTEN